MKFSSSNFRGERGGARAFTLIEVVVSMLVAVLVCSAILRAYILASRQTQWASCSLAANAQAMKKLEQTIYATWRPAYGTTNLFNPTLTNVDKENLELPIAEANFINCTNYTTISQISANPPYVMVRVDCVWSFMDLGTFTNTVAVLRGPDL